jgi:hypothetical protein
MREVGRYAGESRAPRLDAATAIELRADPAIRRDARGAARWCARVYTSQTLASPPLCLPIMGDADIKGEPVVLFLFLFLFYSMSFSHNCQDDRFMVFFDIDNTLYSANSKISHAMGQRIHGHLSMAL